MVGVPGKYKGCNTCRARRVACDNGRPFCKKCTDYGRECGGYERETVFIVGTPEEKGRCSSHPPRNQQSRKAKENGIKPVEKLEFVATEPWQPAWMDMISVSSQVGSHRLRFVALQTDLSSAVRPGSGPSRGKEVTLSLGRPCPFKANPTFGHEPFSLKSRCLIQVPARRNSNRQPVGGSSEGLCLFLYEQNSSAAYSNEAPWKEPTALSDQIRKAGPAAYQSFPAHHFYARVYRPSAIWASLLNRQPTYLCSPEWTVVPWERHPRTPLDDLLDILVLLPSIFSRADRITPLGATVPRRLKARDLLSNCVNIERQFDIWYTMVHQRVDESGSPLYWVGDAVPGSVQMPFPEVFHFPSPLIGLVHVYYWAALIGFNQCIYGLLDIIFESENENLSGPVVLPEIPSGVDFQKYHPAQTRMIAANVCRSLDFVLRTTAQPDLLAAPFWAVSEFYEGIGRYGEGELERRWCAGFKERLEAKCRDMSPWLQEKKWVDARQFG
ncbi:hypothetical protein F4821DRAFT_173382 [Hypoxylon rubiginosum]|uniref:Uncharacterized protein n=1 Tax=Hypoxylon rubiginosum TaxID=110542 RepID=A0ACC0DGV2_9PEZI|nr:hypothetical protein F4821DRAFT_173382 [Hypoxylon rubiginosum]